MAMMIILLAGLGLINSYACSNGFVHWLAETNNAPDMLERGWSKQTFKPGDESHSNGRTSQERQSGWAGSGGSARQWPDVRDGVSDKAISALL